jgi:hypothetical protein
MGLPNVATTLAGLGLAQTFTATQTFSDAPTAPSYDVSGTQVVGARITG